MGCGPVGSIWDPQNPTLQLGGRWGAGDPPGSNMMKKFERIQISSGHLYLPGEIGYNKLENKSWLYHFLESGFNFYVKKPSKYIPIGEIEKVKDYGR